MGQGKVEEVSGGLQGGVRGARRVWMLRNCYLGVHLASGGVSGLSFSFLHLPIFLSTLALLPPSILLHNASPSTSLTSTRPHPSSIPFILPLSISMLPSSPRACPSPSLLAQSVSRRGGREEQLPSVGQPSKTQGTATHLLHTLEGADEG